MTYQPLGAEVGDDLTEPCDPEKLVQVVRQKYEAHEDFWFETRHIEYPAAIWMYFVVNRRPESENTIVIDLPKEFDAPSGPLWMPDLNRYARTIVQTLTENAVQITGYSIGMRS